MSFNFAPGVILSVYGDIVPNGARLVLYTGVTYPKDLGPLFVFKFPFVAPTIKGKSAKYIYKDVYDRVARAEDFRSYQDNQVLAIRSQDILDSGYGFNGSVKPEWGDFLRLVVPAPYAPEPYVVESQGNNAIPYDTHVYRVIGEQLEDASAGLVYQGKFFRRPRAAGEWERLYSKIESVAYNGDLTGYAAGITTVRVKDPSQDQLTDLISTEKKISLLGEMAFSLLGGGGPITVNADHPWRVEGSSDPTYGTPFHEGLAPGIISLVDENFSGTAQAEVVGTHGKTNSTVGPARFEIDTTAVPTGEYFLPGDVGKTLRVTRGDLRGDYVISSMGAPHTTVVGAYKSLDVQLTTVATQADPAATAAIIGANRITLVLGDAASATPLEDVITINNATNPANDGTYRITAKAGADIFVENLDGSSTSLNNESGSFGYDITNGGFDQDLSGLEWEHVDSSGETFTETVGDVDQDVFVGHVINDTILIIEGTANTRYRPQTSGFWRGRMQLYWFARPWYTGYTDGDYAESGIDIDANDTNVIELPATRDATLYFREVMEGNSIFIEGVGSTDDVANGIYKFESFPADAVPLPVTFGGSAATTAGTNIFDTDSVNMYTSDIGTLVEISGTDQGTYIIASILASGTEVELVALDGTTPSFAGSSGPFTHVITGRYYKAVLQADFSTKIVDLAGNPDSLANIPWRFIPTVPATWVVQAPLFDWDARVIATNVAQTDSGPNVVPSADPLDFRKMPITEGQIYVADFQIDISSLREEDYDNTGKFRITGPPGGKILPGSFKDAYGIILRGDPDTPIVIKGFPIGDLRNSFDLYGGNYYAEDGALTSNGDGTYNLESSDLTFTVFFENGWAIRFDQDSSYPELKYKIFVVTDYVDTDNVTLELLNTDQDFDDWLSGIGGITGQTFRASYIGDNILQRTPLRIWGDDLQGIREPEPELIVTGSGTYSLTPSVQGTYRGTPVERYFRQNFYIKIFDSIEAALSAREAIKAEISALMTKLGQELPELAVAEAISYGQVGEGLQEAFFTP